MRFILEHVQDFRDGSMYPSHLLPVRPSVLASRGLEEKRWTVFYILPPPFNHLSLTLFPLQLGFMDLRDMLLENQLHRLFSLDIGGSGDVSSILQVAPAVCFGLLQHSL